MNSKSIKLLYASLAACFILAFLPYIFIFSGFGISKNPNDWGVFGDYIGGMLNPITSSLNVIAFIFLTKALSDLDKRNIDHDQIHQRKLLLTNMRHMAYSEFTNTLGTFSEKLFTQTEWSGHLINLSIYIHHFRESMTHLFPFLEDKRFTRPLINILTDLSETAYEMNLEKNANKYAELKMEFSKLISKYTDEKIKLTKKFQEEILS